MSAKNFNKLADRLEDCNGPVVYLSLTKDEVDSILSARKLLDNYKTMISALVPHLSAHWFVAGKLGGLDENGLPDKIEVCPAYGAGWTQLYVKTDRTISTEGS
jgi:hypothetical protein